MDPGSRASARPPSDPSAPIRITRCGALTYSRVLARVRLGNRIPIEGDRRTAGGNVESHRLGEILPGYPHRNGPPRFGRLVAARLRPNRPPTHIARCGSKPIQTPNVPVSDCEIGINYWRTKIPLDAM